jgi:SAM-dependent methyltransferase
VRGTFDRTVRARRQHTVQRDRARADRAFDARLGVETAAWVRSSALRTSSPNRQFAVRYQPSDADIVRSLIDSVDEDLSRFAFVDVGAGKGRVLIVAAEYPFARLIGVEFSEPLVRTARTNVAQVGGESRIELLCMDAVDFEMPPEPLVVYFFNPFSAQVLSQVLAHLRSSLDSRPRPAYILLVGPPPLVREVEDAGFAVVRSEGESWETRAVFALPQPASVA